MQKDLLKGFYGNRDILVYQVWYQTDQDILNQELGWSGIKEEGIHYSW